MQWLDRLPTTLLIFTSIILALAPLVPEPHSLEKIRMLWQGELRRPIDIADLFFHLSPSILLLIQLIRKKSRK